MRSANIFLCLLLLGNSACTPDPAEKTATLRVMTFNIEWGGEQVSFDSVVAAIRTSGADVVGVQEAEGNLEKLAEMLGWHYDRRNYVVSRFPLLDPPGADGQYVFVEASPGRGFALSNLHLPSDPYGPDLVRDGADLGAVLANEEQVRIPALQPYLDNLPRVVDSGIPVIVTGDFNSPAHTDWTKSMVGARRFLKYEVEWPVSAAMQRAGFKDTWRTLFPDPAISPGLTWWAGRPPIDAYSVGENDAEDRIDYIWYAGPATPEAAYIAGEDDGAEVSTRISPWPSDHRAVYADFDLLLSPLPELITTNRRVYHQGQPVEIRAQLGTPSTVSVVHSSSNATLLEEFVTGADSRLTLYPDSPGEYVASVSAEHRSIERRFWILPLNAQPEISVDRVEGVAVIRWRNAPGNRNDYIALYEANATDLVNDMLSFSYVGARPHGEMETSQLFDRAPDHSRAYVARLMKDDGYEVLAETSSFEVSTDER